MAGSLVTLLYICSIFCAAIHATISASSSSYSSGSGKLGSPLSLLYSMIDKLVEVDKSTISSGFGIPRRSRVIKFTVGFERCFNLSWLQTKLLVSQERLLTTTGSTIYLGSEAAYSFGPLKDSIDIVSTLMIRVARPPSSSQIDDVSTNEVGGTEVEPPLLLDWYFRASTCKKYRCMFKL
jgi:hypothetical protein